MLGHITTVQLGCEGLSKLYQVSVLLQNRECNLLSQNIIYIYIYINIYKGGIRWSEYAEAE